MILLTGSTGGQFKIRLSFSKVQDCDVLISCQYNPTEDELVFTIATNTTHKWVSFTQVPTLGSDKMVINFYC